MKIDRSSLIVFNQMVEKLSGTNEIVLFLLKRVLAESYFQSDFQNKIILMMARKPPDKWSPELADEFLRQVRLLLWILGPIWVTNKESFPCITLAQFKEANSNEVANDWDDFYAQFGQHDPLWQDIIDDALKALKMSTSRIIVGRIARIFMVNLPDPITVD